MVTFNPTPKLYSYNPFTKKNTQKYDFSQYKKLNPNMSLPSQKSYYTSGGGSNKNKKITETPKAPSLFSPLSIPFASLFAPQKTFQASLNWATDWKNYINDAKITDLQRKNDFLIESGALKMDNARLLAETKAGVDLYDTKWYETLGFGVSPAEKQVKSLLGENVYKETYIKETQIGNTLTQGAASQGITIPEASTTTDNTKIYLIIGAVALGLILFFKK